MTFINDLQGSNHTLHLPPSWEMMEGRGGGGLSHFSEGLHRRDLIQIVILGGNWHFS